jgi:ankyrin repeat protein
VDVNMQDWEGWTALHWAAWRGKADVAGALLEAGADPDTRNHHGATPLDCAKANRHAEIIGLLEQAIAKGKK